jgi:hypothetical protein
MYVHGECQVDQRRVVPTGDIQPDEEVGTVNCTSLLFWTLISGRLEMLPLITVASAEQDERVPLPVRSASLLSTDIVSGSPLDQRTCWQSSCGHICDNGQQTAKDSINVCTCWVEALYCDGEGEGLELSA